MNPLLRLRRQRAERINTVKAISQKAADENRDLTPEEIAQSDELLAQVKIDDVAIKREEEIARLAAEASVPIDGGARRTTGNAHIIRDAADKRPIVSIGRLFLASAAQKTLGQDPGSYMEKHWPDDRATKDLALSVFASGGALAPSEDFRNELIALLTPQTVVRASGPAVTPMPLGQMTVPKITGGATMSWIGEAQNMPKSDITAGQVKLTAKKAAVLIVISNDLVRNPSASAEALVQRDLIRSLATGEDLAYIRNLGTAYSPTGLRYAINSSNRLTVNATVNLANISQDLGRAENAIVGANVIPTSLGWLMSHRTRIYLRELRDGNGNKAFPEMSAANPTLNGFPVKATTAIPNNLAVTGTNESEIYLVNWDDVIIGETLGFLLKTSDVAAYHDGSTVQAAMSLDQTVMTAILEVDLAMRYDYAGAVLTDVDWN